jgi:hypothetical protein
MLMSFISGVVPCDFSKAFDKVTHSLLQHKLDHYDIRGKTGEWIKTFLSDRSQSVVIEGVVCFSMFHYMAGNDVFHQLA